MSVVATLTASAEVCAVCGESSTTARGGGLRRVAGMLGTSAVAARQIIEKAAKRSCITGRAVLLCIGRIHGDSTAFALQGRVTSLESTTHANVG